MMDATRNAVLSGSRPRFRLGIGGRLWLALLASAAMSLGVAAVALFSFETTRDTLVEIADEYRGDADALRTLVRSAQALVLATQGVAGALGPEDLRRGFDETQAAELLLDEALRAIRARGGFEGAAETLETTLRRLSVQTQLLLSGARHAASRGADIQAALERLRPISQEFWLILSTSGNQQGEQAAMILRVLAEVAALERASSSRELEAVSGNLRQAIAAMQADLARLGPGEPIRLVGDGLGRLVLGETGLLEQKQRYLGARGFVAARQAEVRALGAELQGLADNLAAQSKAQQEQAMAALNGALDRTVSIMILIGAVGVAGAGVFSWLYVGRSLIARLTRMRDRMLSLASGDFDTPIDQSGTDEIASMARALGTFRQAMRDLSGAKADVTEARDRLTSAVESLSEGFALFDRDGNPLITNRRIWALLPEAANVIAGSWNLHTLLGWLDVCDIHAGEPGARPLLDRLAEGEEFAIGDSEWIVAGLSRTPAGEYVFVATDITRMKEREAEARRSSGLLEVVFEQLDQGIGVYNADLKLERSNGPFATILNLPKELAKPGTSLEDIYRASLPFGMDPSLLAMQMDRLRNQSYERRAEIKTNAGRLLDLRRGPMPDGGYVVSFSDITEERKVKRRMAHLMTHDPITDLLNREAFEQRVKAYLGAPKPSFVVALMLVVGFKEINETFGREAGDLVLLHVADTLRAELPHGSVIARYGADEFAILLPDQREIEDVEARLHHCLDAVDTDLAFGGLSISVTTAMGLVGCSDDTRLPRELMHAAGQALALASLPEADSRIKRFDDGMGEAARRRAFLRGELPTAIQTDQIWVAYQPKVDLGSGRVVGMEALARWSHPKHGAIGPAEFMPVAERGGTIVPLSNRIMKTAARDCARWNEAGFGPLKVAVNISPVQLLGQDVCDLVRGVLREFDLPPECLEVEITEGILMQDDAKVLRTLHDLRDLGISLAIDDFGTGYSSLSYLKRLPVSVLKVDRAFVKDLPGDTDAARLTQAILGISQDFKLQTVAEGVEDKAQVEFLRLNGCNIGQGFLFGRPMDRTGFQDWLAARNAVRTPEAAS